MEGRVVERAAQRRCARRGSPASPSFGENPPGIPSTASRSRPAHPPNGQRRFPPHARAGESKGAPHKAVPLTADARQGGDDRHKRQHRVAAHDHDGWVPTGVGVLGSDGAERAAGGAQDRQPGVLGRVGYCVWRQAARCGALKSVCLCSNTPSAAYRKQSDERPPERPRAPQAPHSRLIGRIIAFCGGRGARAGLGGALEGVLRHLKRARACAPARRVAPSLQRSKSGVAALNSLPPSLLVYVQVQSLAGRWTEKAGGARGIDAMARSVVSARHRGCLCAPRAARRGEAEQMRPPNASRRAPSARLGR